MESRTRLPHPNRKAITGLRTRRNYSQISSILKFEAILDAEKIF